jgi:hypothetical protein
MSPTDPSLGTIVEIPVGRGVVRFSGATSFSSGKWVGIELYEPKGKNDGSVGEITYFTCKMGYGVFVRPSQVKATFGSENEAGPSTVCHSLQVLASCSPYEIFSVPHVLVLVISERRQAP